MKIISKAKAVHYQSGFHSICRTDHGHMIKLTKNENLVTCRRCQFLIGKHPRQKEIEQHQQQLHLV